MWVAFAPGPARAQQGSELPPEAKKRLDSLVGKWTSQWEYLDAEGKVIGVATGGEVGRYAQGDWLVEWTNEITQGGVMRISKAWWFYNKQDKKIYLTSVGQDGDLWVLSGDPVEFTITSWPKKRADGSTIILRFHHSERTEGEKHTLHAVMEYSLDDGKTWTRSFRQTMTPAG
jgi:hypothetical protein